MPIVTTALGLVSVVVALAGAAVCAMYLGRSKFAIVLLGGFVAQATVLLAYRVVPALLGGGYASDNVRSVFTVLQLAGLVAQAAIVGGVAGLLMERPATTDRGPVTVD